MIPDRIFRWNFDGCGLINLALPCLLKLAYHNMAQVFFQPKFVTVARRFIYAPFKKRIQEGFSVQNSMKYADSTVCKAESEIRHHMVKSRVVNKA